MYSVQCTVYMYNVHCAPPVHNCDITTHNHNMNTHHQYVELLQLSHNEAA